MAKVFLSYAREDESAAKQLADCIGRFGHDVWWDRHIQGGSRFSTEIDRELKSAEAVVVLWSPDSVESAWVQDEAAEGRDTGRLVPVSLGGSRPPLGFRQFHTVELAKWNGDGEPDKLADLLEAITKTAGNNASVKAPPSEPKKETQGASVCVLPFVNMSGDPEQEYFSDGITEDIITDLSKVSALLVIARNTAFTFKGRVMDVKEVALALGFLVPPRRQVRLAREPERLQAGVEGLVVEAVTAVLPEHRSRGVRCGRILGDVQSDGSGLGEAGSGAGEEQESGEEPRRQPCGPVRAT